MVLGGAAPQAFMGWVQWGPCYPLAMESMTISKFKAVCTAVLERVHRTGQPVRITRSGEPVAEIVPVSSPPRRQGWLGSFRSSGKILGDIVSPAADEAVWDVLRT